MDLARAYLPVLHFEDDNGRPLVGGKLCTYDSVTDAPVATYADKEGTENPVQIPLDSRGECEVWLDTTRVYKFVLLNKHGRQVAVWKDITADGGSGGGSGGGSYTAGEGIRIENNAISLEYLSVNSQGEVCITYEAED